MKKWQGNVKVLRFDKSEIRKCGDCEFMIFDRVLSYDELKTLYYLICGLLCAENAKKLRGKHKLTEKIDSIGILEEAINGLRGGKIGTKEAYEIGDLVRDYLKVVKNA